MSKNNFIWSIETLRLTGFLKIPQNIKEMESWWSAFTGIEPQEKIFQGSVNLIEKGPWEQGLLQLTITPFRFDFVFVPPQNPLEMIKEPSVAILGDFPDSAKEFIAASKKWLENPPVLNRLAFGCVLVHEASDKVEGYKNLEKFLSPMVEIDSENSRDLFYQINRPRASKAFPKVLINRVSKWNVMGFIVKNLSVVGSQVLDAGTQSNTEKIIDRLELDISTDQNHTDITKDQSGLFLDEFIENAKEISVRGDVK
jgi:hypothetical protein